MECEILIANGSVVIPPHGLFKLDIAVRGGKVIGLLEPGQKISADRTLDVDGKVVLPGVIDPHTHVGYAGPRGMPLDALADQYDTETASALIGGVTTLLNTYRNELPYKDIFEMMRKAGEENARIDFGYSLGILNDEQAQQIPDYYDDFGITSFKFYMAYRGGDATASGNAANRYDDGLLYEAMRKVAEIPGGFVMVHPENIDVINRARAPIQDSGREDLAAWTESRPDFAEAESIRRALYLGEQAGCPVYIPHLSCAKGLDVCLEHRARKTNPVIIEVCSHHLTHTKNSDVGILGKVNPPLREQHDIDMLWNGLVQGNVDLVGSDHAGVTRAFKEPSIWQGSPGFAGIATLLPVMLDAVNQGRWTIVDVARVTSYNTARIFSLYPRKGTLMVGSDADLTVVDMNLVRKADPAYLRSSADFSIYENLELRGWPVLTMVRGSIQMENGEIVGEPGFGQYLPRQAVTAHSLAI